MSYVFFFFFLDGGGGGGGGIAVSLTEKSSSGRITVESRFLQPPRETETGSRNRRWYQMTLLFYQGQLCTFLFVVTGRR